MSTPPRIKRVELREHLRWITNRRVKVDDPHRGRLPDPEQADPRDVLDYLAQFSGPAIPRWVRRADVTDGLALLVWLWWEDRRRELALLRRGHRLGMFLTEMGAPLGITTRQGVQDRMDRLEALLKYDRPDEQISREARRLERRGSRIDEQDQGEDPRLAWVVQHEEELATVARRVLAAAGRFEIRGEWLEELVVDLKDGAWSPGSLPVLGLAVSELRTAPSVLALETTHNVHRAIRAAEDLRARFAAAC